MNSAEIAALAVCVINRRRRRRRRFWVHPLISDRLIKGQFITLYEDLRQYPDKFFSYFRMKINTFDELLALVTPKITFQDTNMRLAIPPVQRLVITLRYLATGDSFHDLHFQFLVGVSTVHYIVMHTCHAIWESLMPIYMPEKSLNDWKIISEEFYRRTNFPNVIGAVDGKHIEISKPNQSGSLYYNYKNYFSIILMAVADANYSFISIDVGAYGGSSDSNVFKNSEFYRRLESGQLKTPEPQQLPNELTNNATPMPFVLLGDEAFGLSERILRPYPNRNLSVRQRIYNYRLSRARRMVECSFGILTNKWRILNREIDLDPNNVKTVTKACCVLHNYVRIKDGFQFSETLCDTPLHNMQPVGTRSNFRGVEIRDYFAAYFTSPEGSLPWQYNVINRRID